jgi:hypothetical protein
MNVCERLRNFCLLKTNRSFSPLSAWRTPAFVSYSSFFPWKAFRKTLPNSVISLIIFVFVALLNCEDWKLQCPIDQFYEWSSCLYDLSSFCSRRYFLAAVYAEENLIISQNCPCLLVSLKQDNSYVLPIVNRRNISFETFFIHFWFPGPFSQRWSTFLLWKKLKKSWYWSYYKMEGRSQTNAGMLEVHSLSIVFIVSCYMSYDF